MKQVTGKRRKEIYKLIKTNEEHNKQKELRRILNLRNSKTGLQKWPYKKKKLKDV